MAKQMITASIDVTKIDKTKLVKDKEGKPKYLNIVIWVSDEPDQFGNNASIQQSQTKEEREAKTKPVYLGNGKTYDKQNTAPAKSSRVVEDEATTDDLPF